MFKKTILILLSIFVSILCGCSQISKEPAQKAKQSCDDVLRFLESKDTVNLKSLFCEKIQEDYVQLDDDIEKAMNFFQGEILSYDHPLYGESESIRDGEYYKYSVSPSIHEIKTDSNRKYHIIYYYNIINKDYPESIGISEIMITAENGETCKIGEYYIVNPD